VEAFTAGYQLLHLSTVDSTNAEAKRILQSASYQAHPTKLVISANEQTAGRGRYDRQWISESGNLYCSILSPVQLRVGDCPKLSFVSVIALKKTLEAYVSPDVNISYKWPNDLLVNGKKIAGILLEMDYIPGSTQQPVVIVGMGLNIKHHPENTSYPVTHLTEYSHTEVEVTVLLKQLITQFEMHKSILEQEGFTKIRQLWIENAQGLGTQIEVHLAKQHYSGIFTGLGQEGELMLLLNNGDEKQITAGDVFLSE
jgi:BirA family transcriptional regulator, biotin operon repressor / biotin---[acetyl-CoA-carboxylase] ligase